MPVIFRISAGPFDAGHMIDSTLYLRVRRSAKTTGKGVVRDHITRTVNVEYIRGYSNVPLHFDSRYWPVRLWLLMTIYILSLFELSIYLAFSRKVSWVLGGAVFPRPVGTYHISTDKLSWQGHCIFWCPDAVYVDGLKLTCRRAPFRN